MDNPEAKSDPLNDRSTKNTKQFKRIKLALQSHSIQSQLRSFQTNPPFPFSKPINYTRLSLHFSLHKQTKGKDVQRKRRQWMKKRSPPSLVFSHKTSPALPFGSPNGKIPHAIFVCSREGLESSLRDDSCSSCLFLTRRGVLGIRGVARGCSLI